MDAKQFVLGVFEAAVEAVKPDRLIRNAVALKDKHLSINKNLFDLSQLDKIVVLGAGKASALMARALEQELGQSVSGGIVVTKYGHACVCEYIEILEAGHPYPDQAGVEATKQLIAVSSNLGENDLAICLWSGGGSALMADFPENCSLEEWTDFSRQLVNSGASIHEINAVRKHLSRVKGGQLARLCQPARVISLALSDVVGDSLDVIASGPTVPDSSTFAQALEVLVRYGLREATPRSLLNTLTAGAAGQVPETPKPGDPLFNRAVSLVIGSNRTALEAGRAFAEQRGGEGVVITDKLEGDTVRAAEQVLATAILIAREKRKRPLCLLFGGETTLKVTGSGLGGRNQHFALAAARLLQGKSGTTLLAAGTDGTDGPTTAAGALVDSRTWQEAVSSGLHPENSLAEFDSFRFFESAGGHVVTGPTMTNVMDVVVVVFSE